jgi:chemotaxis protein CheZ
VITASHIPAATDELDAIVAHTAAATNSILECCESLDTLGPTLSGDASATLQDVTTRIYEACSFQDITGQRITKIVATLKSIESKVGNIIRVFSRDGLGAAGGEAPEAAPAEEAPAAATLLNGPQLPSNAMDQSDIDALLAELG